MSVTVYDIARLTGTSTATVSRVLNGSPRVSAETRQRIERVIAETGYVRPPSLSCKAEKTVCIVLSDDTDRSPHAHPTVYTILSSIKNRLAELGVASRQFMPSSREESVKALLALRADGYIFLRTSHTQEDVIIPRLLAEKPTLPILMVNRRIKQKEISYVNIDDYAAEFNATEHLIKCGCRRIAFVNGDISLRNAILRRNGFLGAMKKHSLEVNPKLMLAGKYSTDYARRAAEQLLELPPQLMPDGIVTSSDVLALGIEKELLHRGIEIPGDVQLIGFGDEESARYTSPPLTTISIPAKEMGIQAANAIDFLIGSSSIQTIKINMRSELKTRGTTLSELSTSTERKDKKIQEGEKGKNGKRSC